MSTKKRSINQSINQLLGWPK